MKQIIMKKVLFTIVAAILVANVSAQIKLTEKNIDAVLKQMTLQEKADLLVGCIEGTNYFGVPQPTGSDPSNVILIPGAAGQTNKVSRLGIPATVVADGPAGLRISPTRPNDNNTYYCTGYPVPILMASTWNTPLVQRVGSTVGKELKEYGVDGVPVNIKDMADYGFCSVRIQSGKLIVTDYNLNASDKRSVLYKIKTAFHEAFHASGNGFPTDIDSMDQSRWLDLEETFAESSAHYMASQYGITDLTPSYPDKLVKMLPRLKKLPEFKGCKTIADFGKVA